MVNYSGQQARLIIKSPDLVCIHKSRRAGSMLLSDTSESRQGKQARPLFFFGIQEQRLRAPATAHLGARARARHAHVGASNQTNS